MAAIEPLGPRRVRPVNPAAWRPHSSVAYVPGFLALLDLREPGGIYAPVSWKHGELICDICWLREQAVIPVGSYPCSHGGER